MRIKLKFSSERKLVALLKACALQKDLPKGTTLHAHICKRGLLETNLYVANSLITMYAKCGAFAEAQKVLSGLPALNIRSWNALVSGYTQHGRGEEALRCYDKMQSEGHSPNAVTFTCALKACAAIGAVAKGEQIHDETARWGLLQRNILLGTAVVDMYAKCGVLGKAQAVLDELPLRDVVSWNAIIAGYVQHGQADEALKSIDKMQCEGHSPNAATFSSALKAYAGI